MLLIVKQIPYGMYSEQCGLIYQALRRILGHH